MSRAHPWCKAGGQKKKKTFPVEVCLCRGNSPPSALAIFPRDHKLKKCDLWLLLMFSSTNPFWSLPSQHAIADRTGQSPLSKSVGLSVGLCACGLYSCVYNPPWSVVPFYNSMRLLGPLQAMNRCSQTSLLLTGCLCPSLDLLDSFLPLSSSSCFLSTLCFLGAPLPLSSSPPAVFLIYQNNF